MNKMFKYLKVIFHLANLSLLILYLYPGSIFGYILYGSLKQQPNITRDFLISSNHFYAFILLSFLGIIAYVKDKRFKLLISYLFLISIILELFHLIIPERGFQLGDLFGNLFGVLVTYILFLTIKKTRNKAWKKKLY